jgi:WD40 repeat protein
MCGTRHGKEVTTYDGHDNIVLATAIAPDGATAAIAGGDNNEIHLWNLRDGKLEHALTGVGRPIWSVGFSPGGRSIAWGIEKLEGSPAELGPLGFTLKLPTGDTPTGKPKPLRGSAGKFVRAVTTMNGLELKTRASGEFGYLDLLDIVKLGEFVGHTSDVWAVAVSPDGRFLLSESDDQTVRLWNMATRENIVSLFSGRDGEWVLWTPQGYYAASPAGDAHVGWHVNEGEGHLARFVGPAQTAFLSPRHRDACAHSRQRRARGRRSEGHRACALRPAIAEAP